ncbi:MAG: DUF4847 family protein [Prevotellaceae bacterium]|jgi:hypothetical protein|nr:DUF4847 family protein [Prevotellaceae bacterium]
MKNQLRFLLLLLLGISISACNQEDDVEGIFTGKTWKLTGIFENGSPERMCMDYWNGNSDAYHHSVDLLGNNSMFYLTFNGLSDGDVIRGSFAGQATTTQLSGEWSADAVSRNFAVSMQSLSDADILGKAMIEGLRNATSYGGDYNNLRIYFKRGTSERHLLFHVANQ